MDSLEIGMKHGVAMHIVGLEHAIRMIQILDKDKALAHLQEYVADQKKMLDNMEHSRHNPEHFKNCENCKLQHEDFMLEQHNEQQR